MCEGGGGGWKGGLEILSSSNAVEMVIDNWIVPCTVIHNIEFFELDVLGGCDFCISRFSLLSSLDK